MITNPNARIGPSVEFPATISTCFAESARYSSPKSITRGGPSNFSP